MWLYCTYYGPKLLVLACPQLWSWQVHCQKELLSDLKVLPLFDNLCWSKPSLEIRTARAIFWNYLGIFRDYGLKNILLEIKLFSVFQDRTFGIFLKLNFVNSLSSFRQFLLPFFSIGFLPGVTKCFFRQIFYRNVKNMNLKNVTCLKIYKQGVKSSQTTFTRGGG